MTKPEPIQPACKRRVVCAAIKIGVLVICGARHYDKLMIAQIQAIPGASDMAERAQGFIDQRGEFMDREEAHKVASEAGQIIRRCGGDDHRLFSENLY